MTIHRHPLLQVFLIMLAFTWSGLTGQAANESPRKIISLDGTWQVAEGKMDPIPTDFSHTVPVPGLVSLAQPRFVEPGPKVALPPNLRHQAPQKDPRRDAFWYRRTFQIDEAIPSVATLKVSKAMFGTRVFLNGKLIGDHFPCFTPGYFNVHDALKQGQNELLIRVGADRDALGQTMPTGMDLEKDRYIPGIFDSVELILSSTPHILTVQAAPDIESQTVYVQARIRNDGEKVKAHLKFTVREAKSGAVVGSVESRTLDIPTGAERVLNVRVPVANCHLWSPEDPFLYNLEVSSDTDHVETRFGMREFHLDPKTGYAYLNGKQYFLRGSNTTLYRFFEDDQCKNLPWREDWVRNLHRSFKEKFSWNSLRYSIGFPPEAWYRIADEEGILIQDEFPIWSGSAHFDPDELADEYTEWMQERWNHPCVVIWDAQNETQQIEQLIPAVGKAVAKVRGLDLSRRPWDNGFGEATMPGDCYEIHRYRYYKPECTVEDMATMEIPEGNPEGNAWKNPLILNEYCGMWINRDGTPTTLGAKKYNVLFGKDATPEQLRHTYAVYLAAETEFYRSTHQLAGIMHFTGLGYSRHDGQTCDSFLDVEKLVYEPEFQSYLSDAFAPVGLMIDAWAANYAPESAQEFPVVVINDLEKPWKGDVTFRIKVGDKTVAEKKLPVVVAGYGTARTVFSMTIPKQSGTYQLEASLNGEAGKLVRSRRDFNARRFIPIAKVTASSSQDKFPPENAIDGNKTTRWGSMGTDNEWICLYFGSSQKIAGVDLYWQEAFGSGYKVQVSQNGETWTDAYEQKDGKGNIELIKFASPKEGRYLRLLGVKRATKYGYSLFEIKPIGEM